jgi:hypothetical protein
LVASSALFWLHSFGRSISSDRIDPRSQACPRCFFVASIDLLGSPPPGRFPATERYSKKKQVKQTWPFAQPQTNSVVKRGRGLAIAQESSLEPAVPFDRSHPDRFHLPAVIDLDFRLYVLSKLEL